MEDNEWLDTEAAAKYLARISASALEVWRQRGEGPSYTKFGDGATSPVRYRKSDLDAWVAAHTVVPSGKPAK